MTGKSNEQGQTLIVVFAVMIIALGIGVGISSRFIKALSTYSQRNMADRALAVAEAAAERLLLQNDETLGGYITNNNCGSNCQLEITTLDGVTATASVVLSFLGNSSQPYIVAVDPIQTMEINLSGYPNTKNVQICWNNPSGDRPSFSALYFYGSSGSYATDNYSVNAIGSTHSSNGFAWATAANGYANCFTVTGKTSPVAIRLRAFYNSTNVAVFPAANTTLPSQGILIESTGIAGNATKKVSITRIKSFLPSDFDYALLQKSETETLSN